MATITGFDSATGLDFTVVIGYTVESVQGDSGPVALHNTGPGPGLPQFRLPISGRIIQDS